MATKNTTKHIAGNQWEEASWFNLLLARAQDLAMDKDHSFTYADRDRISSSTSRKEIVHLYETAYSELAESFVGHLERIDEVEGELTSQARILSEQREHILNVEERLAQTMRRLTGMLSLIEQPIEEQLSRQWFPDDQHQAMKPR